MTSYLLHVATTKMNSDHKYTLYANVRMQRQMKIIKMITIQIFRKRTKRRVIYHSPLENCQQGAFKL